MWRRNIAPQLRVIKLEWVNFQVLRRTHSSLMKLDSRLGVAAPIPFRSSLGCCRNLYAATTRGHAQIQGAQTARGEVRSANPPIPVGSPDPNLFNCTRRYELVSAEQDALRPAGGALDAKFSFRSRPLASLRFASFQFGRSYIEVKTANLDRDLLNYLNNIRFRSSLHGHSYL